MVVDHTAPNTLIDPATATLSGGLGNWEPWFSTSVARVPIDEGGYALQVTITGPNGWGVQLANPPGYEASPGRYRVAYWARQTHGEPISSNLEITSRDANGTLHQDVLTLRLTGAWQGASEVFGAPAGTLYVGLDLVGSEGGPGDVLEIAGLYLGPTR